MIPLPEPMSCAGCGTTEAAVYLETNAGVLGHAQHALLCSACWQEWMRGRRWGKWKQGRTDDLEAAWQDADEGRESAEVKKPGSVESEDVDLFGKKIEPKKRRRR